METIAIASATLAAVMSFGIAILAQLGKLGPQLGRLEGRLDSIDEGIRRLNRMADGFLISLSKEATSSDLEERIKKLEGYVEQLKPRGNPISAEELEKFKTYIGKIGRREFLSYEEYSEYKELGERIKKQLPKEQRTDFELLLAGLISSAAGATIRELLRRSSQSER